MKQTENGLLLYEVGDNPDLIQLNKNFEKLDPLLAGGGSSEPVVCGVTVSCSGISKNNTTIISYDKLVVITMSVTGSSSYKDYGVFAQVNEEYYPSNIISVPTNINREYSNGWHAQLHINTQGKVYMTNYASVKYDITSEIYGQLVYFIGV